MFHLMCVSADYLCAHLALKHEFMLTSGNRAKRDLLIS